LIKITVHESVEVALRQAFPKPAAAAQRALGKYIAVLESLLFAALQHGRTPEQIKFDLYSVSLDQLANKGGQIGRNKLRLHKWLSDNNLELLQTVVLGNKFSGQYSQVKLSSLVKLTNTLTVPSGAIAHATTDEDIDKYLLGTRESNKALFQYLYPEFATIWGEEKISSLFHQIPVDIESVKAYLVWVETESAHYSSAQKDLILRQALTVIGVATFNSGYFVQRIKPSPFGRTYYEGTSIQNVNKDLRRAILGDSWEYDIRSSVVAWKMGFARSMLLGEGLDPELRNFFQSTLLYLEDKRDFMNTVQYFTFGDASPVPKDFQPVLLKQAFTAISFGARQASAGWQDSSGNWTNPALVNILQNTEDRKRFLTDKTVQKFIYEQNQLDTYIFNLVKEHRPNLLEQSFLQTDSGRVSKAKVLAYLYQHAETQVMDIVRSVAKELGHTPIANVHDAIFFKRRLGVDAKYLVETAMREQTGNPYWHLTPKKLERFKPKSLDAATELRQHKQRIADEELFAKGYQSPFSNKPEN